MYSDRGKRYKTLSASSVGTIKGYSTSFFVSEKGRWIFLWDADGKKYKALSKNMVGDVIGVAGNTFTSQALTRLHLVGATYNNIGYNSFRL